MVIGLTSPVRAPRRPSSSSLLFHKIWLNVRPFSLQWGQLEPLQRHFPHQHLLADRVCMAIDKSIAFSAVETSTWPNATGKKLNAHHPCPWSRHLTSARALQVDIDNAIIKSLHCHLPDLDENYIFSMFFVSFGSSDAVMMRSTRAAFLGCQGNSDKTCVPALLTCKIKYLPYLSGRAFCQAQEAGTMRVRYSIDWSCHSLDAHDGSNCYQSNTTARTFERRVDVGRVTVGMLDSFIHNRCFRVLHA